jgi:hypothetical protein
VELLRYCIFKEQRKYAGCLSQGRYSVLPLFNAPQRTAEDLDSGKEDIRVILEPKTKEKR